MSEMPEDNLNPDAAEGLEHVRRMLDSMEGKE